MGASREAIIAALFAQLAGAAEFKVASRRNRAPENISPAETPALFLVEVGDKWDVSQGYDMPAKRNIHLAAIVYVDVGPQNPNGIPSTIINNTLDAFEALMQPDNVTTGTYTLGGLVQACLIDGESQRASGDVTGKGLAVVPIRILIP